MNAWQQQINKLNWEAFSVNNFIFSGHTQQQHLWKQNSLVAFLSGCAVDMVTAAPERKHEDDEDEEKKWKYGRRKQLSSVDKAKMRQSNDCKGTM